MFRWTYILIVFLLLGSCARKPALEPSGVWKGVDEKKADSISLVLRKNGEAEYTRGKGDTAYGNWKMDTSANGKYYIAVKVYDPVKPGLVYPVGLFEVLVTGSDQIKLRLNDRVVLERYSTEAENPPGHRQPDNEIQKIVYTSEELSSLYNQKYESTITPARLRLLISDSVKDVGIHIDRSYHISAAQFEKFAGHLGSISACTSDVARDTNCITGKGIYKEISYYNRHGLVFTGWVYYGQHQDQGNIKEYINLIESEMYSLIPDYQAVSKQAERVMDSLLCDKAIGKTCLTNSMYKILGLLDEYISRFDFYFSEPIPNYVESFGTGEKIFADYFEQCIQDYRKESGLNFDYSREVFEGGGSIFRSTALSRIINSYYIMIDREATLDGGIFENTAEENKLSYVESAYKRYGDHNKNRIRMANGFNKIHTLATVLKQIGCSDTLTYYVIAIPSSSVVVFFPNQQLKTRLNIKQILTRKDLLPELEQIRRDNEQAEQMFKRYKDKSDSNRIKGKK
jgi:hypothetical protein